eukprot:m.191399 g.191399  ORF g.191399 m.191399 type:complete len:1064 (-) comp18247_c0_seq4:54-3245(-)
MAAAGDDGDEKAFFRAIKNNDEDTVARLVQANPSLLTATKSAYQAVSYAVTNLSFGGVCSLETVRLLLDLGAAPDGRASNEFNTALHIALDMEEGTEQTAVVGLLVERGADTTLRSPEGKLPLRMARGAVVKAIIADARARHQAYIDRRLAEQQAAAAAETAAAQAAAQAESAAAQVAQTAQATTAAAAAAAEPAAATSPTTPTAQGSGGLEPHEQLQKLIKQGELELVSALLDEHPDCIARFDTVNYAPLERAGLLAWFGNPVTGVPADDPRASFWQTAATSRRMVQLLLQRGADPNTTKNDDAMGPLHYAVMANDVEIVRMLLEHGADPRKQADEDRITPLSLAIDDELQHVTDLLQSARNIRQRFLDMAVDSGRGQPADRVAPETRAEDAVPEDIDFENQIGQGRVLSLYGCQFRRRNACAVVVRWGATNFEIASGVHDHAHVCKYLARIVMREGQEVYVAEQCGVPLRTVMAQHQQRRRLSPAVKQAVLCQVCDGLKAITGAGLSHPNLTPSSIMVGMLDTRDVSKVHVRVNGYGLRLVGAGSLALQCDPRYTPPEVYETTAWTAAATVFAFAVTAWYILSDGAEPFGDVGQADDVAIRERVVSAANSSDPFLPRPSNGVSDALWALLLRCFSREPTARPGFHELLYALQPTYHPLRFVRARDLPQDFADRSRAFYNQARTISDPHGQRQNVGHHVTAAIRLVVTREHVLHDTLRQMRQLDPIRWRDLGVNITFGVGASREAGLDWGALTKEWLTLLCKALFITGDHSLFEAVPDTEPTKYRLKADAEIMPQHGSVERLHFIGQILGFMLWHHVYVDVPLVRSLFFHLLGRPLRVEDLSVDDARAFQSLEQILTYSEEELEALDFSFEYGSTELCEGGADMVVGLNNRHRYVEAVAGLLTHHRCQRALSHVIAGFQQIVPVQMLQSFAPHELEIMLCGFGDIDLASLRRHTRYQNCRNSTNVVRWLWNVLDRFSPEEQRMFLRFVTGSDRAPPLGFGSYVKPGGEPAPFTIMLLPDASPQAFPAASTCFNILKLPSYRRKGILAEKLREAIQQQAFHAE